MKSLLLAFSLWFLLGTQNFQPADLDPGYWEQTPLPLTGLATFYAPGMMEYVFDYRQAQGEVPECLDCVGTVALLRAGDLGRKVWLQPPDGEPVGPFLVIDCAHTGDIEMLLARDWAVDVSYELGQLWGMDRPLAGVTVLEDPADRGPITPLRVPTPFVVRPGEALITAPTATPAITAQPPTPWPTRLPAALHGGLVVEPPRAAPTPAGPPPLTPIITTPTPRGAAPPSTPVTGPRATPTVAPDQAIGRPGQALLGLAITPSPPPTVARPTARPTASPTPTPRPAVAARTPAAPILPAATAIPAQPAPGREPPLIRLWRALLSLLMR